jgi:drug/metabolite transporter (DMT)-like permease
LIFALDLFVWHKSVLFIGPGLATILGNFQVFILALVGVAIFGERLTLRLVAAIPAAMLGLFLVVGFQWRALTSDYRIGVIFGLITAVCFAGYTLTLRRLQGGLHRAPPISNLAMVSLVAALFLGLLALGEGAPFRITDINTAGALSAYGILSQACGWALISKGLPGVRASLAGLLILLQPSLAYVWDILIFGLPITPMKIAGTIIALLAIYLGSTSQNRANT